MPRVIGIDFSTTSTGIAVLDVNGWSTHTVKSAGSNLEKDAAFYARMRTLNVSVLSIIQPTPDDVIGMESTFRGSGGREARLHYAWHRFRETFHQWAPDLSIGFEFAPTSVKKLATGHGGSATKKPQMLAATADRLGLHLQNRDDEADAVWIAVATALAAGLPVEVKPLPESAAYMKGIKK